MRVADEARLVRRLRHQVEVTLDVVSTVSAVDTAADGLLCLVGQLPVVLLEPDCAGLAGARSIIDFELLAATATTGG
jgi:hypothetical protein